MVGNHYRTQPFQLGKIVKESIRFKGEICMESAVSITTLKDLGYICTVGPPDLASLPVPIVTNITPSYHSSIGEMCRTVRLH